MARISARPKITQKDLAARLQIQGLRLEQAAISKIESGYRDISDVETAAIAKALGVTIDWLFDEGEHAQNKRRNKPSQNNKRILS